MNCILKLSVIERADSETHEDESGEATATIISMARTHVDEMYAHALSVAPEECCGLVGGQGKTSTCVYQLRNMASESRRRYEASPEDLFGAQKQMRTRREELLAIYHSHPRDAEPVPSETDVRLAFYPNVVYFIIGFRSSRTPVLRSFRINAEARSWEKIEFRIV